MSNIEWTDETWNVLVGCSKVSEGCRHCYAINQAYRNNAMAQKMSNPGRMKYYEGLTQKKGDRVEWTGIVKFVSEALEIPLKWKKPRKVFVNSMSDLFHESVSDEHLDRIFAVIALTPHHTYQILTKRPERMQEYLRSAKNRIRIAAVDLGRATNTDHTDLESCQWDWPLPNTWMGVTVENQKAADDRIPLLLQTPAALRFLSVEPLLEAVELTHRQLNGNQYNYLLNSWSPCGGGARGATAGGGIATLQSAVDWIIVGGESGPNVRPFNIDWARSLRDQCKVSGTKFFFKQAGSNVWDGDRKLKLRDRKGGDLSEIPEDLRIREVIRELI
jgi:protein gp37